MHCLYKKALKSTKISSYEPLLSEKYENGYRTKNCDFYSISAMRHSTGLTNVMFKNCSATSYLGYKLKLREEISCVDLVVMVTKLR